MVLRLLLISVCFLACNQSFASYLLSEDQDLVSRSLGQKVQYLVEDGEHINFESLSQNPDQFNWKKTLTDTPNFGFNVSPHWFLMDLANESVSSVAWLLQIKYPLLDFIDVYLIKDAGKIEQWHTGDQRNYDTRTYDYRNFLFPIELETLEEAKLLIRVDNAGSMQVPMILWDEKEFYKSEQKSSIPNGIFMGLFLVLIIYNFFLYISTKDSSYLYYVLFASSFISFFMSISGYGFQYIWPNSLFFQQHCVFVFVCLANIGMAEFTIRFLRIPEYNRIIYRMLRIVTVVTSIIFCLMIFLPYKFMIQVLMLACLYTATISTIVGLRKIATMGMSAIFYASGWVIMAVGIFLLILNKFAVIEATLITEYAAPASVIIFSLLLSFALGIRIQEERKSLLIAENKVLSSQKEALQSRLKASKMEFENKKIQVTAEAESRSKNAFLAMMSHEIRTPLNGIMGLSQLLKSSPLDEKQKQYADTIYSSGESLLTIINDILDFSKILAGKLDIESIDVNAFDLISNCTTIFASQLKSKNILLYANIEPALPIEFQSDPVRLRQVLLNYLSNAIKFTDHGEIHLSLKFNKNLNEITIEVDDQGIGIPKEKQSKLFDAFSQADSSTTRRYGGTGLGLAICKQISKLMDGDVGVKSSEGEGSMFWFKCKVNALSHIEQGYSQPVNKHYLAALNSESEFNFIKSQLENWQCQLSTVSEESPDTQYSGLFLDLENMLNENIHEICANHKIRKEQIFTLGEFNDDSKLCRPLTTATLYNLIYNHSTKYTDPLNKTEHKKSGPQDINGTRPLNGLHILIAEDNQVNQLVIKAVLKKLGSEFTLVENGELAVEAMHDSPESFDLILMDCEMPIMDGFTATERIRALPENGNRHIPIIALTAHAMAIHKDRAQAVGMNGFVSKPLKQEELVSTIHNAIKAND